VAESKKNSSISVILPAYNEADSLKNEVEKIRTALQNGSIPFEFIVIDDGSTDDTYKIAQTLGVKIIRHPKNRGVGAARKSGILASQNEMILTSDADGTYPSAPIPKMIQTFLNEDCDMVVGARVKESGTVQWIRLPAKFLIRKLASYLVRERIPDLNSGLRVFKKSVALKYFYLLPDSHSWESTITIAFLSNHAKVQFIPIDYFKRTGGKSSFDPIRDTYNYLSLVIRTVMYFNPLRIFLPLTGFVFFIGITKILYDWIIYRNIGGLDVTIMLTAILILIAGLLADLMVVLHKKSDPPTTS